MSSRSLSVELEGDAVAVLEDALREAPRRPRPGRRGGVSACSRHAAGITYRGLVRLSISFSSSCQPWPEAWMGASAAVITFAPIWKMRSTVSRTRRARSPGTGVGGRRPGVPRVQLDVIVLAMLPSGAAPTAARPGCRSRSRSPCGRGSPRSPFGWIEKIPSGGLGDTQVSGDVEVLAHRAPRASETLRSRAICRVDHLLHPVHVRGERGDDDPPVAA